MPYSRYFSHYARARAFAAKGEREKASAEVAAMRSATAAAEKTPFPSVAPENGKLLLRIADSLVSGKLAEDPSQRLASFRKAVAAEDRLGYNEPPDWIEPTREVLGGELLRQRKFVEAEQVFRDDLKRNPHNPRSLFGLAESLKAQGKDDSLVRREFEAAWQHADEPLTVDQL
jgi:hypothetical protein